MKPIEHLLLNNDQYYSSRYWMMLYHALWYKVLKTVLNTTSQREISKNLQCTDANVSKMIRKHKDGETNPKYETIVKQALAVGYVAHIIYEKVEDAVERRESTQPYMIDRKNRIIPLLFHKTVPTANGDLHLGVSKTPSKIYPEITDDVTMENYSTPVELDEAVSPNSGYDIMHFEPSKHVIVHKRIVIRNRNGK